MMGRDGETPEAEAGAAAEPQAEPAAPPPRPRPAGPAAAVLGSVVMELSAEAPALPSAGEVRAGTGFRTEAAGGGARQAAQLARAGAPVDLIARIGRDDFGDALHSALSATGAGLSQLHHDPEATTGVTLVHASGAARSALRVGGAADALSLADVEAATSRIEAAAALLLQLELPVGISTRAAEIAAEAGADVVLNASPAPADPGDVPAALWQAVSVLAVNRAEAGQLLGRAVTGEDAATAAAELGQGLGVGTVLLTLGAEGAVAWSAGTALFQPAFEVAEVVDPRGAGDAFLGAFCAAGLAGDDISGALRRGAAAGALAVGRAGAFDALPTAAEIDAFLTERAGG
ncbi:MAG: PfkB family carbohydrate kinase [Pseudomonadota bacterium]